MNTKVKESLHPPGASLHSTPHYSSMNSAILAASIRSFRWVKTITFCAFTLTILENKHLQLPGEEVKAKIGKHRTRGRARLGENAMVFVRKRGAEKEGYSLRFFELCTKCTRHTAGEKGDAFVNCSVPRGFVDGFGKNETRGRFPSGKVVNPFGGFTVCTDFPLVNLHASASGCAHGQEAYRRIPSSFSETKVLQRQRRKKAAISLDIRGAKRNFAANLKYPLFSISLPFPTATGLAGRRRVFEVPENEKKILYNPVIC